MTAGPDGGRWAVARRRMVADQLVARGIHDPRVLAAMAAVPREWFVPAALQRRAYDDSALPIAAGQTISQPYIVACMLEALALCGGERVLEIGTGSGYAAAVLGRLAGRVYTIERLDELAAAARARLAASGATNVEVRTGDGSRGWPEAAPFDAIVVAAAATQVPPALPGQLAAGGRLVLPVGPDPDRQQLLRLTRTEAGELVTEQLCGVRFVPLISGA